MSEIEIRANLNFEEFRQGQFYRASSDNMWVQALVWARYFTVTDVMEVTDEPAAASDPVVAGIPDVAVDFGMEGLEEES